MNDTSTTTELSTVLTAQLPVSVQAFITGVTDLDRLLTLATARAAGWGPHWAQRYETVLAYPHAVLARTITLAIDGDLADAQRLYGATQLFLRTSVSRG